MKKKIAIATIICMISASSSVFAQEVYMEKTVDNLAKVKDIHDVQVIDKEVSPEKLKLILTDVKQRFVVYDQDASFKYSLSLENGINMYNLSWDGPKYSTYIKYGEDKNVYWYYSSKKDQGIYSETRIKQLPGYEKKHAQDIAQAFLQKALPSEYKNFKLKQDSGNLSSNMYSFEFIYTQNDIKVDGVMTNVLVDAADGKIISYSTSMDSSVKYNDIAGTISKEEAKKAYENELGVKLIYQSQYDYEKNKIDKLNLVYIPNYSTEYVIDAKTGKRINISSNMNGGGYAGVSMLDKGASEGANQVTLTEQEIADIKSKADLASLNEAKAKVKSYNLEILDSNMAVESAQLYESKENTKSGYIWSISYIGDSFEKRASVELDAKSLDLIGFNSYNYSYSENEINSLQVENAKKDAEKILNKYSNIKLNNLLLDENSIQNQLKNKNAYIYLTYNRVENNVEFPENYIDITYDVSKQKIISYRKNWYEIKFPSAENIVSKTTIYDKIFKENDISLKYKISYNKSMKAISNLVYEVNQDDYTKPLIFDALTGKRVIAENYTSKPELKYSDVEKSKYKEEINTLLALGIGFQGSELKPQTFIRQDELLYLISQTFEYVPVPLYKIESLTQAQKKEIEDQLRYIGVLAENETMTAKQITKEETAKYLVRALGYEKIASHSEIFKLGINDATEVEPSNIGYIAISDALNIIIKDQKNNFSPKEKTTREEALKMIYNYLK